MLGCVGEELTFQREQHPLIGRICHPGDLDRHLNVRADSVTASDLLQCGAEADVVEHVGVQVEDLLAQLSDRVVDYLPQAQEALGVCGTLGASQVVPSGDQVLQG